MQEASHGIRNRRPLPLRLARSAQRRCRGAAHALAHYFKSEGPRPTLPEIAAYYRERKMACVVFPVDMESTTGLAPVPNEEVAEVAAENPDP